MANVSRDTPVRRATDETQRRRRRDRDNAVESNRWKTQERTEVEREDIDRARDKYVYSKIL